MLYLCCVAALAQGRMNTLIPCNRPDALLPSNLCTAFRSCAPVLVHTNIVYPVCLMGVAMLLLLRCSLPGELRRR